MRTKSTYPFESDFKSALEYLQGDDASISPSILFWLSDPSRGELQAFANVWVGLPAERRRRVSQAMGELAEERIEANFTSIFRYLLDDEDPDVRANAINGLWEEEDASLVRPFIAAMRSDASARVRAAAAEALGRFVLMAETNRLAGTDADEIRTALLAAIRNGGEDQLVRRRAIESIAYVGDETVRDIVASAYATDDIKMRATAIFAMGRSADSYWKRTVAMELFSPDPQIRYEAARAAGELEVKAVVPRLVELIQDPDLEVQTAAITSLGQIGGKEAKRALSTLVQSDDEVVRELAQDALDELEFQSADTLLLYDIGLESQEQELLEQELAELDDEDDDLDAESDDQDLELDDLELEADEDEEDEE